jgi:CRP/FNR family transcriptional regulator, dissimilatory nitrate respiration regulator
MLTTNRSAQKKAVPAVPKGVLGTLGIFKGLSTEVLRELEGRMVERRFTKGGSIFLEGDPALSVWFVKEGHVKASASAISGRCQTLCMVGKGHMFGSCCCFGAEEYPCHAVAETDVTVVYLPMGDFLSLLDRHPRIGAALVKEISQRLRHTKDSQTFEQESVERRILHALVDLVAEFGNTLPLTKREVAEMVGTTVESSIRTFSRFEKEGLVATTRGRITVKSLEAVGKRLVGE